LEGFPVVVVAATQVEDMMTTSMGVLGHPHSTAQHSTAGTEEAQQGEEMKALTY
jgi:hypothetical protein